MTENGRKLSAAARKLSVGCEGEKVSAFVVTRLFYRNVSSGLLSTHYGFGATTHCGRPQILNLETMSFGRLCGFISPLCTAKNEADGVLRALKTN
jgi:hypothetical protein